MRRNLSATSGAIYVGVDGGSTHLRAAVCNRSGRLLSTASTAGLLPMLQEDGSHRLQAALLAVDDAVPSGARVDCVYLALTGVDLPEDEAAQVAARIGRSVWPASLVVVQNDGMAAWAGATGCLPGVAVMAGTGCVVVASDDRGVVARTGGWGPVLGDAGGGWGIGVAALREMLQRLDQGQPPSELDRKLLAALQLGTPLQVPGRVTSGLIGRADVADLLRVVMREASHDVDARRLLDWAARALTVDVQRAINQLSWTSDPIPVVPTGNAFQPPYLTAFKRALRRRLGIGASVRDPTLSSVGGALLLALRESGQATHEAVDELGRYAEMQPGGMR